MAYESFYDADGVKKYRATRGLGTTGDPAIATNDLDQIGGASAAALADNAANPTVHSFGSYTMVFDGSTWDRWQGGVTITAALPAGTNAIGSVVPIPSASATGMAPFRSLDLDETEEEVKGSAGNLYKLRITNHSTSKRYVKLYDATAAGTTVGTTTPVDTIPVPGATDSEHPTVITESYGGLGLAFSNGLCLAATTGLADDDTGAPGANEVVVSAYCK